MISTNYTIKGGCCYLRADGSIYHLLYEGGSSCKATHQHLILALEKLGFTKKKQQLENIVSLINEKKIWGNFENINEIFEKFQFQLTTNEYRQTPSDKIELLACQALAEKQGKTYSPPTLEEYKDMIAKSLSELKEPFQDSQLILTRKDALQLAEKMVAKFGDLWDCKTEEKLPEGLKDFEERIQKFSSKPVCLKYADADKFKTKVRGACIYMELTVGNESKLMHVGPYETPFSYDV